VLSVVVPHLRQTKRRAVAAAMRYRHSGVKAFWALGDQGVASLGNFLCNLILARTLGLAELGLYGVLYELGLFLNSVHAATVLFPLNVRGAVADGRMRFARLAGRSLMYTLLLAPVLGIFLLATGAALERLTVGLWAMVALVMFQIQETLRRSLIARMRYRGAVWGDAVSYLGQATALYLLAAGKMLTLSSAYQAFALTSAVGALVQVSQVGPRVAPPAEAVRFATSTWGLSRWVLFGNLTNLFTGTFFYWNLAFWAGREMLGVALGLINVIRLANPLLLAFASVIVPTVARARGRAGFDTARRLLFSYGGFALTGLALLFAVPFVLPAKVLRIFYPHNADQYLPYTHILQIMLMTALCVVAKDVLGAFFNAVERPRLNFIGQAVYTASIVLIAMPLTARLGLWGLVLGGLSAAAIGLVVNVGLFQWLGRRETALPTRGMIRTMNCT
jgi:O-antigen/teichoic acid export membrane protein